MPMAGAPRTARLAMASTAVGMSSTNRCSTAPGSRRWSRSRNCPPSHEMAGGTFMVPPSR